MIRNIHYLREQGRRENVEDTIFPEPGTATPADRVFLVCDGVGGEAKGEIASKIVCDVFGSLLQARKDHTKESIEADAQRAMKALHTYADAHPEAERMSTTVTMACMDEGGIWVGWCGDSRIYHIRNGRVLWRSKDHSFVQMLVNIGQITEEEAMHHEKRNIILKSFSAPLEKADLEVHRLTDIQAGDYLLLCTDGLLEQITDGLLYQLLEDGNKASDKAALFNQYCNGKTSDNYSMYLIKLGGSSSGTGSVSGSKGGMMGMAGIGALLIAAGVYGYTQWAKPEPAVSPAVDPVEVTLPAKEPMNPTSSTPLPTLHKEPAAPVGKKDSVRSVRKKPELDLKKVKMEPWVEPAKDTVKRSGRDSG
jgi:protein phosphatase